MSYAIIPGTDRTYRIADHDGATIATCETQALAEQIVDALRSPRDELAILAEHRLERILDLVKALEAIHKLADSGCMPPEALRTIIRAKAREALNAAKGT